MSGTAPPSIGSPAASSPPAPGSTSTRCCVSASCPQPSPQLISFPWQLAAGADRARRVAVSNTPDLEPLLTLGIDLVLASERLADAQPDEIATYQEIAPVIVLPNSGHREQLRIVGETLDIAAAATTVADELDALFAGFRPARRPASISVCLTFDAATFTLYGPDSPTSGLLRVTGLPGLALPPSVAGASADFSPALSLENLALAEADLVIGLDVEGGALTALEAIPAFATIPAVRDGRYRRIAAPAAAAVANPSPLSLPIAIQALTEVTAG